ncbi:MAG: hypothetical protein QXZ25_04740 [Candidatus Bathyarchaeia archaeon]
MAILFANNVLSARIAENEFSAMKQFMQTVGLQIDDVAWIPGRAQTVRYASRFGHVDFKSSILKYTIYVNKGGGDVCLTEYSVGALLFNMPVNLYTIRNNHHERIFPSSSGSFVQNGTSALVAHVFVVEKVPMGDGSFVRVVVIPTIRMLNSTISSGQGSTNYAKFYLPILSQPNEHPRHSQSVTLTGVNVRVTTDSDVNSVRIAVSFPRAAEGFDAAFFKFDDTEEIIPFPSKSVVEFYTGEVNVTLGLHA